MLDGNPTIAKDNNGHFSRLCHFLYVLPLEILVILPGTEDQTKIREIVFHAKVPKIIMGTSV